MAQNDIDNVLDHLRRIKSGGDVNSVKIDEIETLEMELRFLRTFLKYHHEKLKGLQTRIQFMAENVGLFCLALWVNEAEDDADSKEDEDDTNSGSDDTFSIESKPPYLLFLVVLVELEMKKIFLDELKTSKYAKSRTFKDKKLPKGLSHHLHSLLMYLRQTKLKNIVSALNIDVAIEFLLVFLGDVPNHVINGKRLNEVLAKIGVLVDDIQCVIQMLLAGSTIKEDASKIDLGMIQISKKIEDLKAQVEERYKSLKYSPSNEFPTVGGLSFLDSLLRKLNEMLKSESSLDFTMKPQIGILEEDLSYLTSVFRDVVKVQHKQDEIFKDLQRRIVNLAYEAEVSIDSIVVQYNALWHFFGSLPAIIKEIKHILCK